MGSDILYLKLRAPQPGIFHRPTWGLSRTAAYLAKHSSARTLVTVSEEGLRLKGQVEPLVPNSRRTAQKFLARGIESFEGLFNDAWKTAYDLRTLIYQGPERYLEKSLSEISGGPKLLAKGYDQRQLAETLTALKFLPIGDACNLLQDWDRIDLKPVMTIARTILLEGVSSKKLTQLVKKIGLAPFVVLIESLGQQKAHFILHHYIQNIEDFSSAAEFYLYAFACGKYLLKATAPGRFEEIYPVKIEASRIERQTRESFLEAIRKLSKKFGNEAISPEICRSFIERMPLKFK